MKDKKNWKEFMNEENTVNRWFVVKIFIVGAFCGGLLTIAFSLFGLIK